MMYNFEELEDGRFLTLQYGTWYYVPELLSLVNALKRVNFSIAEQRLQALSRLNAAGSSAPFDAHRRFPERGRYVCESHGDWGRKMQQLRLVLALKARDKDPGLRAGVQPAEISDAIVAYHSALGAIVDQVTHLDGVLDRDSFEGLFPSLDWVA